MEHSAIHRAGGVHPGVHSVEFSQYHRHSVAIATVDTRNAPEAALFRNVLTERQRYPAAARNDSFDCNVGELNLITELSLFVLGGDGEFQVVTPSTTKWNNRQLQS